MRLVKIISLKGFPMHHLTQILDAHPHPQSAENNLGKMVAQFAECSQSCYACADACLAEGKDMLDKLRHCISTDLACAAVTQTMATLLTRQTAPDKNILRAVAQACEASCRSCAEECEKHADMHAHCKHCGMICRICEKSCRDLAHLL